MARVAVTGAAGQLGRQLVARFEARGNVVLSVSHVNYDITLPTTAQAIVAWGPDLIVNAAAWTDVDGCARDPARAMAINGEAPGALAAAASRRGAGFIQVSTNEVFDGGGGEPYAPDDIPHPINPYGASKLRGEQAVAVANDRHLIVRTAWLFGPGGRNFVTKILTAAIAAIARGEELRIVADEIGNPTWTPALADRIVDLSAGSFGLPPLHVVGTPPVSRLEWARAAFAAAGLDVPVQPVSLTDFPRPSAPPPRAVLQASLGIAPINWREVMNEYVAQVMELGSSGVDLPQSDAGHTGGSVPRA